MAVQAQPHAQLPGGAQVGEALDLQGLDDGARPPGVLRCVVCVCARVFAAHDPAAGQVFKWVRKAEKCEFRRQAVDAAEGAAIDEGLLGAELEVGQRRLTRGKAADMGIAPPAMCLLLVSLPPLARAPRVPVLPRRAGAQASSWRQFPTSASRRCSGAVSPHARRMKERLRRGRAAGATQAGNASGTTTRTKTIKLWTPRTVRSPGATRQIIATEPASEPANEGQTQDLAFST